MKVQTNRGIIPWIILSIIALFLCLFIIGYFTTQHPFGLPNYKESLHLSCGLTVTAPKQNEKISFPYKVTGYANGCGWQVQNTTTGAIGTYALLAPNGLVLSHGTLQTESPNGGLPYYFETTVDVPVMLGGEKGTLIFDNGGQGYDHKNLQVPFVFSL